MKKLVWLLLAVVLTVALMGCGEQETKQGESEATGTEVITSEETKTEGTGTFRVGYARNDATPKVSVPLAGYGNTLKRMSNGFLDYTYTTCVAIIDESGQTLLMFTTDVIGAGGHADQIKERLGKTLGLSEEFIIVTATHTHSNIDQKQTGEKTVTDWIANLVDVMEKTANEAIADAVTATMQWTTCDLTGYNFTRHYFGDTGIAVGDNHNSGTAWGWNYLVGHTTEANHIMYMVKFVREDKKDVLMCNWRAHPTITGGSDKTNISADYVGAIRQQIEKSEDVLFAYFQGEAGNQNPKTRLNQDVEYNPPTDVKQYGKEVVAIMSEAMKGEWEEVKTGLIYTVHEITEVEGNHERLELREAAVEIQNLWKEVGTTDEVTRKMMEAGIHSPYEAGAIVGRTASGNVQKSIHATVIGDLCITNLQAEQFDTNGSWIRDNSPSKYTLVMAYTDDNGYVPSQYAYEYGCYEADTTVCAPGSGEVLAARELELLKQMWEKSGK